MTKLQDALVEASFFKWAAEEPDPRAIALAREWGAIADARGFPRGLLLVTLNADATSYRVAGAHGNAESSISLVDALDLFIDAHRTRAEDLGSTRDLAWWASTDKHAAAIVTEIGNAERTSHPRAPVAEHDSRVLAAIASLSEQQMTLWRGEHPITREQLDAVRLSNPSRWASDRAALIAEI